MALFGTAKDNDVVSVYQYKALPWWILRDFQSLFYVSELTSISDGE